NDARQAYVLKGVAARQLGSVPLADAMKRGEPSLGVAPEGSALVTQVGPQPGIVFFGNGRYTWVPFAAKAAAGKATAARPRAANPPARSRTAVPPARPGARGRIASAPPPSSRLEQSWHSSSRRSAARN